MMRQRLAFWLILFGAGAMIAMLLAIAATSGSRPAATAAANPDARAGGNSDSGESAGRPLETSPLGQDREVTVPGSMPLTISDPATDWVDQLVEDVSLGESRFLGVMTKSGANDELDTFAEDLNRKPNLIAVTAGWERDSYSDWFTARVAQRGALPIIAWEPWDATRESSVSRLRSEQPKYSIDRVLNGDFDERIDEWATALAAYERPVGLRFAHEMNGNWYPWAEGKNGNPSGSYVELWRYVHDRFEDAEADNVIWIWSPNVIYTGSTPLEGLFPGPEYVDWLGVVGYFGHHRETPTKHPGFEQLFRPTIDELRTFSDLPVLITETAGTEDGGFKDAWTSEVIAAFAEEPDVLGFVWFNVDKETDWRISSSVESLAAFRTATDRPIFSEFEE